MVCTDLYSMVGTALAAGMATGLFSGLVFALTSQIVDTAIAKYKQRQEEEEMLEMLDMATTLPLE